MSANNCNGNCNQGRNCDCIYKGDMEMTEELIGMREGMLQAVYGKCPVCGVAGKTRERRLNGNDTCINGHTYPSAEAIRVEARKQIAEIDSARNK
jgi:hypothetical protein